MSNWPLLSLLIWFPILGSVLVVALPRAEWSRWVSMVIAIMTLGASVALVRCHQFASANWEFVERLTWVPTLGVGYHLAVDGIAIVFIVLTALMTVLGLLSAWATIDSRVQRYVAAFLVFEGLTIGTFAATDAMLFYVFFEATLLPLYLMIGGWSQQSERRQAARMYLLYSFISAVPMLLALLYLYNKSGSFQLVDWYVLELSSREQISLFLAFFLAFAVKMPLLPVHSWLPYAHNYAPIASSIALTLKLGGYGLLRFNLPIAPDASGRCAQVISVLSVVTIVWMGLIAIRQRELKKLVAYSSAAHAGLVTLGIFAAITMTRHYGGTDGARLGLEGAVIQMVSNTLVAAAMFAWIGILWQRTQSSEIAHFGGLARTMPQLAFFAMLFVVSNLGLPGTCGFIGELCILIASFQQHPLFAIGAGLTLIISAAYSLWCYRCVFWGPTSTTEPLSTWRGLDSHEQLLLGLFSLLIVGLGLVPRVIGDLLDPAVTKLTTQIAVMKH